MATLPWSSDATGAGFGVTSWAERRAVCNSVDLAVHRGVSVCGDSLPVVGRRSGLDETVCGDSAVITSDED